MKIEKNIYFLSNMGDAMKFYLAVGALERGDLEVASREFAKIDRGNLLPSFQIGFDVLKHSIQYIQDFKEKAMNDGTPQRVFEATMKLCTLSAALKVKKTMGPIQKDGLVEAMRNVVVALQDEFLREENPQKKLRLEKFISHMNRRIAGLN